VSLSPQIHANCRIRRVYFSDRLYSEDELPAEFKLYLPVQNKAKVRHPSLRKPGGGHGEPWSRTCPWPKAGLAGLALEVGHCLNPPYSVAVPSQGSCGLFWLFCSRCHRSASSLPSQAFLFLAHSSFWRNALHLILCQSQRLMSKRCTTVDMLCMPAPARLCPHSLVSTRVSSEVRDWWDWPSVT
jgi:hypothetical protein